MSDVLVRQDPAIEVDEEKIQVDLAITEQLITIEVEETPSIVSVLEGGAVILSVGIPGPQGAPGNDTFVFDQISASASWHIVHHLGKFPSVTIVDSAKSVVIGEITYISRIELIVAFSAPFSGTAYLN